MTDSEKAVEQIRIIIDFLTKYGTSGENDEYASFYMGMRNGLEIAEILINNPEMSGEAAARKLLMDMILGSEK